jgi:hypothetical protein
VTLMSVVAFRAAEESLLAQSISDFMSEIGEGYNDDIIRAFFKTQVSLILGRWRRYFHPY